MKQIESWELCFTFYFERIPDLNWTTFIKSKLNIYFIVSFLNCCTNIWISIYFDMLYRWFSFNLVLYLFILGEQRKSDSRKMLGGQDGVNTFVVSKVLQDPMENPTFSKTVKIKVTRNRDLIIVSALEGFFFYFIIFQKKMYGESYRYLYVCMCVCVNNAQ